MRILMYGPSRKVMGGISSVVNFYYEAWDETYALTYVPTMEDGSFIRKFFVFLFACVRSLFIIPAYDIVHVHMASNNSYNRKSLILKLARLYGKKTVIHVHGSGFMEFYREESDPAKQARISKTFDNADYVIALSKRWEQDLRTITKSPIRVIYNAVSMPKEYDKQLNNNICFLGRLGPRKGVYDLLEVVGRLNIKYKDYQLYIGGDGDIDGVKRIISEKGYDNVHYLGWIGSEEKSRLLRETTLFALPSRHEGLPMALLEAMSYGCIAVSTTVGGIPEVIEEGVNGYLMKPGDKDRLYDILDKILAGEVDKQAMSQAARQTVEEAYTLDIALSNLYGLYDELAE